MLIDLIWKKGAKILVYIVDAHSFDINQWADVILNIKTACNIAISMILINKCKLTCG